MTVGDTATVYWNGRIRVGTIVNLFRSVIAFDFDDDIGKSTLVTYVHNEGVEWIRGVGTDEQCAALRVAKSLSRV